MTEITMYTARGCGYCRSAEQLLSRKGINQFNRIEIDLDSNELETMIRRTGRRTVPQIYIGDRHVGGFHELTALDRSGQLDELLRSRIG